jgi:hypothetical protein
MVETRDGVPVRVLNAHFRRLLLQADGTRDPENQRLEGAWAVSRLDDRIRLAGWPSDRGAPKSFPGLIQAAAQFKNRRMEALYQWKPTPQDLEELDTLLRNRIERKGSARDGRVKVSEREPQEERQALAANPRTAAWKLELLAAAREPAVRAAVARNPRAPAALLEILGRDANEEVVIAVASNPHADRKWLETKAKDHRERIRRAVAGNLYTPPHVIERMAWADRSETVRATAQAQVDADLHWLLRTARSDSASESSLLHAARDRRSEVRAAVAANPRASVEVLALLARDPDEAVRHIVAARVGVDDARSLIRESGNPPPPRNGRRRRQLVLRGLRRK